MAVIPGFVKAFFLHYILDNQKLQNSQMQSLPSIYST